MTVVERFKQKSVYGLSTRKCGRCREVAFSGSLACENIRFSSLFVDGDVTRGGKSATQRQKFHTDEANQCLHNKSGSHGVSNNI